MLSAFLHVGLFLIMLFFVMINARPDRTNAGEGPVVWAPEPHVGPMGGIADPKDTKRSKDQNEIRELRRKYKDTHNTKVETGVTEERIDILAPGPGDKSSAEAELGLRDRDVPGGQMFIGIGDGGTGVLNVVYVVDRSGSMATTFDGVRAEMIRSISRLEGYHYFHVVLFGDNKVYAGPRKRLVPADIDAKVAAGKFLHGQQAGGSTTALVALQRAFAVLNDAPKSRPGKLIYLLSDGDFAGMTGGSTYRAPDGRLYRGNEAVLQWLRDLYR